MLVQTAGWGSPASFDVQANLGLCLGLLDGALAEHRPDIVLLPEMFVSPYFCGSRDDSHFGLAEPIPGPTTDRLAGYAREYDCHIFAPLFERADTGEFYDSCALVGPSGDLVPADLSEGGTLPAARKMHIPRIDAYGVATDEKHWFRPGEGFTTFSTRHGRIAALICYDRSFPESWRSVVLAGAEAVFIPVVSYGYREELFQAELRTRAAESGVFAFACNRGGPETVGNHAMTMFGGSCAVDPTGRVIAEGPLRQGPAVVVADVDLALVKDVRSRVPYLRDRRPDVYRTR
ncbi:nitrilase-related carbon-nitrogen hydrolase [Streptosporangium soli]|nr:hypothetical protein [Streptosporangium sp. KLBMP 9127]